MEQRLHVPLVKAHLMLYIPSYHQRLNLRQKAFQVSQVNIKISQQFLVKRTPISCLTTALTILRSISFQIRPHLGDRSTVCQSPSCNPFGFILTNTLQRVSFDTHNRLQVPQSSSSRRRMALSAFVSTTAVLI